MKKKQEECPWCHRMIPGIHAFACPMALQRMFTELLTRTLILEHKYDEKNPTIPPDPHIQLNLPLEYESRDFVGDEQ